MLIYLARRICIIFVAAALLGTSCSAPPAPNAAPTPATQPPPAATSSLMQPQATPGTSQAPNPTSSVSAGAATPTGNRIIIHADGAATPIDPRLFGTNVPAWINPERLANPAFQARTRALGTKLLRMPGGSWSNYYDWLGCETGDTQTCFWPSAARPSDFLAFAKAVDAQMMWTVSMNGTSKEAAALVAFFNARVDDDRPIGVDIRGRDWKTVGYWAELRSKNGHPDPYPIHLWEVGNEAYGAKQSTGGAKCAAWGWEEVWTCDAADYVNGKGSGAERHEGFLEFRDAMRAVDPTIQVGAIGVDDPASWSQWGERVIKEAGAALDFYVVHLYPYWEQPPGAPDVVKQPAKVWPQMVGRVNAAFKRFGNGRAIPIAVTEYNLVSSQDKDNDQLMLRAVNAFYMADSIGQMAQQGVAIATSWNLANGIAPNGTDYGMVDADTQARRPQYYALWAWTRFGTSLLPVEANLVDASATSVYAGRDDQGTLSLLVINKSDKPVTLQVQVSGVTRLENGILDAITADSLEATDVLVNGVGNPDDDFANAVSQSIPITNGSIEILIAPFSVSLARFPAQTS